MTAIPLSHVLAVAAALFAMGLAGLLVRRGLLFSLVCLEVMVNAAGLVFIAAGARWQQADGQVMFILVLTLAAAEVAVGLALLMQIHQRFKSLDPDAVSGMKA
ncbi:NADH-quinone oxidoreductase subunit NuoK [Sinimarinibacterium sp. NLF-5-8]|uniref:NADH-quinone oxidoreductase subunit NuoK n=1 Tax=Sinimarinibacterium sp. NLF-5-8 TaxID=2698684 RepID=UPI00137BC2A7|nr:NADH-quinone oxidoreductase subunit NuoK [Sinimarinibacterium sp. NLF-5-8]QHS11495.1 NADH-quinone oxidoreductase subunit NuoK [Sinimarinibacterium sp. NLF-5-8]